MTLAARDLEPHKLDKFCCVASEIPSAFGTLATMGLFAGVGPVIGQIDVNVSKNGGFNLASTGEENTLWLYLVAMNIKASRQHCYHLPSSAHIPGWAHDRGLF